MGRLRLALAGNANVGKSTIFNALTGLHQHIGNWPGKTVEKAEGSFFYHGRRVDVLDLPGVYSLTPCSAEEKVAREYICGENPDAVINVADASVLERNLFFTLSLLELGSPVIVALNMADVAERKGPWPSRNSRDNLHLRNPEEGACPHHARIPPRHRGFRVRTHAGADAHLRHRFHVLHTLRRNNSSFGQGIRLEEGARNHRF